MSHWKETIARRLRALHLGSIRNQILAFAVLATLLPTLATTLVFYGRNRRSLNDEAVQELLGASSEAAREIDLWLNQRLDDLRAAAGSYVVAENLAKLRGREGAQALGRLRDYLSSARERLLDHEALLVIDPGGRVVAGSSGRVGGVRLPPDGLNALRTGGALVGEAYLYLMTDQGRLVLRSRVSSADLMRTKLPDKTAAVLFEREGQSVVYQRAGGQEVVGTLRRVPQLHWAAIAELPQAEAFRRAGQLRNVAALMILALLAGVGLIAYVLGLLIARPLGQLTSAAAKVTAGDLSADLPVGGAGEVGELTRAFNTLVLRLRERESQAELERLSITDALTGLYNRRHLMGTLVSEAQRSRRLRRPFSVLLADADHFKQYNDTHGHPAGDAALVKIADILRKTTRAVDCVARYGGEEFLVVLLETTVATAAVVGERIRARVAAEAFTGGRMTMSIGVAECPTHGDTPEELIASADAALYEAKGAGRDRVVAAGGKQEREKEKRRRKGEA